MLTEAQRTNWRNLVIDLRSGKHKQTKHYLCREVEGELHYCCLGRASEILGVPKKSIYNTYVFYYGDYDGSSLPDGNWWLKHYGVPYGTLMSMNDAGHTFPQIADFIEENILEEVTLQ